MYICCGSVSRLSEMWKSALARIQRKLTLFIFPWLIHTWGERNRRHFFLGRKLSFLHPTLICFSRRRLSWSITALSQLFHQHLSRTSTHTDDLRTRFLLPYLSLNNEICLFDCFRRRNKQSFNLWRVSWSVQFELGMRHKRGEAILQSRKINQALQPVFRARWDHGKCKEEDQS